MDSVVNLSVRKFYPTADECKINNLVKCTEGCQNVFRSESNLSLHLMKTHKKHQLLEADLRSKQYYCPELGCIYNNNRSFKSMKFLRQHYMKVHSAKIFNCDLCQKKFPTENVLKNHTEYCGINFKCCDCQASYPCYETLKTHGRRKKHNILLKPEYKSKRLTVSKSEDVVSFKKNHLILPKQCVSFIVLPTINKSTWNQESQTEVTSQNTQQTQTGVKYNKFTVETQTVGDFLNLKRKQSESLSETNVHKNSNTQTECIESKNTSCNTSFNLDDFEISMRQDIERSSSSTQTLQAQCNSIYTTSTTSHDSIHTDTSDLLTSTINDNLNNFEFLNCNMETQTDFLLDDDMFNYDYYMSNMCTQTCDEILNDSVFCDIQTQTAIDDVLRSVESQTSMSHRRKNNVVCKDMSHMETQTDMEFNNMLEVINS